MDLKPETVAFYTYLSTGALTWIAYGVGMYAGRRRMSLLEKHPCTLPPNPPKVTILIPAKDEGEPIRECLASALAQDYPNFEVLAIDDRSTDNTGAIMDEMAAKDSRLRVVHIQPGSVPSGWTGKNNALYTGVTRHLPACPDQQDWFLFVDSDVTMQPMALANVMAFAIGKHQRFVTLLLKLRCQTFWEKLLMPLSAAGIVGLYAVAMANNNDMKSIAFANGQFILCRRDAYYIFGTHEAVKSAFSEDVEIAKLAKANGLKPRVAWGVNQAEVRMYSSLPKLVRGWGRNYFGCGRGSPWRIFMGIFFVLASCYSVYPMLGYAAYRVANPVDLVATIAWSLAAIAHFVLMTFFLAKTYEWSGNPKRNAFLFPLGGVLLLWIFGVALKLCATKKVTWRGDSYAATHPAPVPSS